MAFKPIFRFRNPDSTADLNQAYSSAIGKGVYAGGDLSVTTSNLNVIVAPFTAVSHDGLVVVSDSEIALTAKNGQVNVIALFARYERSADPVMKVEIFPESSIEGSPLRDFFVIFGKIDLTAGGYTGLTYESTSSPAAGIGVLSYNGSHYATKIGNIGLKSPVSNSSELPTLKNSDGDLRYSIAQKAIFAWDSASKTWINTIATTASNIEYGGGPAWADGTTNPAIDVSSGGVNTQINKIITDLGSGDGTAKIHVPAIAGSPTFTPAGTLHQALTNLYTAVNNRGLLSDPNTWSAANVFSSTVQVDGQTTMNAKLTITAGGLAVTGAATFAGGITITSGNMVISGALSAGAAVTFSNTLTVGALATLSGGLAVTGTGTFSSTVSTTHVISTQAPSQFYVDPDFESDRVDDTNAPVKGGGIGTAASNLQAVLERIDAALVRKRAFTAVITDGTNSDGGDYSSGLAVGTALNSWNSTGTFFVRRGTYAFSSASLHSNCKLIGEKWAVHPTDSNGGFYPKLTKAGGNFTIGSLAKDAPSFENIAFECSSSTQFVVNPSAGYARFNECQFTLGSLLIRNRAVLDNCLVDRDLGSTNSSLVIDPDNAVVQGIYLTNIVVSGTATGFGQKSALLIQNTTNASNCAPIVIKKSIFRSAGSGILLSIQNSTSPIVFEDCLFYGTDDCFCLVDLGSVANITFKNCVFHMTSDDGMIMDVDDFDGLVFDNCKFIGPSTLTGWSTLVDFATFSADLKTTIFNNCTFELAAGSVVDASAWALKFVGPIVLRDCEIVLSDSNSYGPILYGLGVDIDGLLFDNREKFYRGLSTVPPFFLSGGNGIANIRRLVMRNLRCPDALLPSVEKFIAVTNGQLEECEFRFTVDTGKVLSQAFLSIENCSVHRCLFQNLVYAPIHRWISVDFGTTAISHNRFLSSGRDSTTSDEGSEIYIHYQATSVDISHNRFSFTSDGTVDTNDPLLEIGQANSALNNDLIRVIANYVSANGAIAFMDVNDADAVMITDNVCTWNTSSDFNVIFGIESATVRGFITRNVFRNTLSGLMSLNVASGFTTSGNVFYNP